MLTTIEQVKSFLGIVGLSYDVVIGDLIENISSFIESATNRKISSVTITEYFNGGSQDIFLSSFPVIAITSVKQNTGTQSSPSWQVIAPSQYTVFFDTGLIKGNSIFSSGSRNIEVVYSAGFVTVPADIELVAKQLVARAFEQRRAQGKSNENIGDAGVGWSTMLTEEQKAVIAHYRKRHV